MQVEQEEPTHSDWHQSHLSSVAKEWTSDPPPEEHSFRRSLFVCRTETALASSQASLPGFKEATAIPCVIPIGMQPSSAVGDYFRGDGDREGNQITLRTW